MAERYHYVEIDKSILTYHEQVYLPVYSLNYLAEVKKGSKYMARVHIINKSQFEPIYLLCMNCYDSDGVICEKLIEEAIKINPLEANQFIVNTSLSGEGTGANVILDWGVKSLDIKPEIYIEMIISSSTNQVSFVDTGKIVSDQDEILDRRPL